MAQKFRMIGTITLEVDISGVVASSEDEAKDAVELMDITPGGEGVKCEYSCISSFECEEIQELQMTEEGNEEEGEDPLFEYQLKGQLDVEVRLDIEADSMSAAELEMSTLFWDIDKDFNANSIETNEVDIDGDECYDMNAKMWDDQMSKMERAKFLKETVGASEDASFDTACLDSWDVPEEWISQLEV
jgi:hypothetical protein